MLRDLTYKVIVIDDEEDLYDDYIEYIEKKLSTEGYRLEHKRYEELSDLDEHPLNDVDLFLVDLKFGKEDKGPEFIRKIRENHLTDILFYSSDASAIQDNMKSGEFQGVFFAVRDENTSEITNMIDQLILKMIKRSNTPLSSRGIILGCVAELDNIIKEKIEGLLAKLNSKQHKSIMDNCTKIYFSSYKGQSKKICDFMGCDFHKGMRQWKEVKESYAKYEISSLVKNIYITDSSKNLQVLLKIYRALKGEDDLYNAISHFSELLNDRNIFAHVQEEKNNDGLYQFKRFNSDEYLVLSEEKCRKLRLAILNYYLHIKQIDNFGNK